MKVRLCVYYDDRRIDNVFLDFSDDDESDEGRFEPDF